MSAAAVAVRASVATAFVVAALAIPGAASPGPKHPDTDHRACVTGQEWKHVEAQLLRGRNPLASTVERGWEVEGLGYDAVLDMQEYGGAIPSRAFPRCSGPVESWWGYVANEDGRVTMVTGYYP